MRSSIKGDHQAHQTNILQEGVMSMALNVNRIRARLEMKRGELQEAGKQLRRLHRASPGFSEPTNGVEDVEENAKEIVEREEEQTIFANQQFLLDEVEQALKRLDEGTYGRCSECGQPIPDKRLEALPWAARDIMCEKRVAAGRRL